VLVDRNHKIPIYRQCELLGLSKSAYYYDYRGESVENLKLMRLIDELYTKRPFYGVLRITKQLQREDHNVNEKRIRRLMRKLGLEAIYPKPNLSKPNKAHKIFPYLLKDVEVVRPDQVWSTDITYIRMEKGFVYLVAVMDWYSRYVISWELSTTLEKEFCVEALKRALNLAHPEIFNSDQGSQFTSNEFIAALSKPKPDIKISMDGKGRVFDNIFVERLWRTVKYEEVYLKSYETVKEARNNLRRYFYFYNNERIHQALDYKTPHEIYFKGREKNNRQTDITIHQKQADFLS